MNSPVILVLAAGAARRMRGRDKLLEKVEGVPLLTRQVRTALSTGAAVVVALPPNAGPRLEALAGLEPTIVEVPDAALGMGHSLAAAARAAPGDAGLLVVPADMPEIDGDALARMIAAHIEDPDVVLRGATKDGTPGHPVLLPARLRPRLLTLTGDEGGRSLLQGEKVVPVPLPGRAALTDLDTPEDWANWRARSET